MQACELSFVAALRDEEHTSGSSHPVRWSPTIPSRTVCFGESSPFQKQSALAAACSLAEQIKRTLQAQVAARTD
jgi:hypothetical protein